LRALAVGKTVVGSRYVRDVLGTPDDVSTKEAA
jgi:hypothetical protein